jgi:hypothetical protein
VLQVARESVKEQVFDVGHLEAVKSKLKALLMSEMTPISEMSHSSAPKDRSLEEEGRLIFIQFDHRKYIASKLYLLQWLAM